MAKVSAQDKEIASSILEFLKEIKAKTGNSDLEAAETCIKSAFQLGESDKSLVSLDKLFKVYKQTQKNVSPKPAQSAPSAPPTAVPSTPIDTVKAEALKGEGNKLLAQKKFKEAAEKYSQAIEADPNNAVYYANRAAASSQLVYMLADLRAIIYPPCTMRRKPCKSTLITPRLTPDSATVKQLF